jgi:hypothetical protein
MNDPNRLFIGLRNGKLLSIDTRAGPVGDTTLGSLSSCIDKLQILRDRTSLLATDVTGQMSVYDVRMPARVCLTVTPPSSEVRSRNFLIPSLERDLVVAYPHPFLPLHSVGVYSLSSPNTLLHVARVPSSAGTLFDELCPCDFSLPATWYDEDVTDPREHPWDRFRGILSQPSVVAMYRGAAEDDDDDDPHESARIRRKGYDK